MGKAMGRGYLDDPEGPIIYFETRQILLSFRVLKVRCKSSTSARLYSIDWLGSLYLILPLIAVLSYPQQLPRRTPPVQEFTQGLHPHRMDHLLQHRSWNLGRCRRKRALRCRRLHVLLGFGSSLRPRCRIRLRQAKREKSKHSRFKYVEECISDWLRHRTTMWGSYYGQMNKSKRLRGLPCF